MLQKKKMNEAPNAPLRAYRRRPILQPLGVVRRLFYDFIALDDDLAIEAATAPLVPDDPDLIQG